MKVVGTPSNIQRARELILEDLDAKSTRVTLKIDVAFSEHSHVIGKEGVNIKKGKETKPSPVIIKWALYLIIQCDPVLFQHFMCDASNYPSSSMGKGRRISGNFEK